MRKHENKLIFNDCKWHGQILPSKNLAITESYPCYWSKTSNFSFQFQYESPLAGEWCPKNPVFGRNFEFEFHRLVHRGFKYVKYGMFGIKWCI